MFMLCWFYCIPFVLFLYYAAGPLFILFACFMIKRGVCRNVLWKRYTGLAIIFVSAIKIFLFDIPQFSREIMCRLAEAFCNGFGIKLLQGGSFSALLCVMMVLKMLVTHFGKNFKPPKDLRRDDKDLRHWANLSMTLCIFLACWLCGPFVFYLFTGDAPRIFFDISWHFIATINFITLIVGFWKAEDCYWYYDPIKGKPTGADKAWVPRDTLWLVLPIYLTTIAFGVMADDVLH